MDQQGFILCKYLWQIFIWEDPTEERHLPPKKYDILGSSFKQARYKIVILVILYQYVDERRDIPWNMVSPFFMVCPDSSQCIDIIPLWKSTYFMIWFARADYISWYGSLERTIFHDMVRSSGLYFLLLLQYCLNIQYSTIFIGFMQVYYIIFQKVKWHIEEFKNWYVDFYNGIMTKIISWCEVTI